MSDESAEAMEWEEELREVFGCLAHPVNSTSHGVRCDYFRIRHGVWGCQAGLELDRERKRADSMEALVKDAIEIIEGRPPYNPFEFPEKARRALGAS